MAASGILVSIFVVYEVTQPHSVLVLRASLGCVCSERIVECVLICAGQACMDSLFQEATMKESMSEVGIFISP